MTDEANWNGDAPFSDNFHWVDTDGFRHQITVRANTGAQLLERIDAARTNLLKRGATPSGQSAPPQAAHVREAYSDAPGQAQLPAPTPGVPPPAAAQHEGPLSFEAESLVGSTSEGKTYWKVRGGMFKKFGVTIWPEVLTKAGFDVEELNPATPYNLIGYTATYLLNAEKSTPEKEVPDKVVSLIKTLPKDY